MTDSGSTTSSRQRALSHKEYLDSLQRPSAAETRRISAVQLIREQQILAKYSADQHDAAKLIQRAYRGHRERRQLNGLNLDPSSRWVEIIKEWRYRSATAPHHSGSSPQRRARGESAADIARLHWRRAAEIAEYAGAGEAPQIASESVAPTRSKRSKSDPACSMLLDIRYFLEMVDQKHRYGSNLQVYHEEWQRSDTDQNFFWWLDRGDGRNEDLSMCPREKLERERIRYLSKEERKDYLVKVDAQGKLRWAKNDELITTSVDLYQDSMRGIVPKGSSDPAFDDEDVKRKLSADASFASKLAAVGGLFKDTILGEKDSDYEEDSSSFASSSSGDSQPSDPNKTQSTSNPSKKENKKKKKKKKFYVSPATILNSLLRASVRPGTWIYVSDTVGRLYVGIKSSGAFQHASFLSGARISSAGIIGIKEGKLIYLSPLSGHYRPTTKSFRTFIANLKDQEIDMSSLKVSKAYAALLGMEYYSRGKKDLKKVMHPDKEAAKERKMKKRASETVPALPHAPSLTATEVVEQNWQDEHGRKGLTRFMDDISAKKQAEEQKR